MKELALLLLVLTLLPLPQLVFVALGSSGATVTMTWNYSALTLLITISSPVGVKTAQTVLAVLSQLGIGTPTLGGFMTGATHLVYGTEHRWVNLAANGQQTGTVEIPIMIPLGAGIYSVTLIRVGLKDMSENTITIDTPLPMTIQVLAMDLTNWPGLFSGRAVLQVIGSGTRHGPFNDYAKVADTLALVDVVGAPGYAPGTGTLTRLDTEVITETGPPWSWSWKTEYTTQDVIAVGGPVVSSLHRMSNTLSKALCMWDESTWEIVCKDGSRYKDPLRCHGYIAVFTDGNRIVLIVSGYSAFVTRGLGLILRNPSAYSSLLQGQAVIMRLIDNNGNGIFELGETVEVIHIV